MALGVKPSSKGGPPPQMKRRMGQKMGYADMYAQAKPKAERPKPTPPAGANGGDDAFRRAQRENAHRRRLIRERA